MAMVQITSQRAAEVMRDVLSEHELRLMQVLARRGPEATARLYRQYREPGVLERKVAQIREKVQEALGDSTRLMLPERLAEFTADEGGASGVPVRFVGRNELRPEPKAAEATPPKAPAASSVRSTCSSPAGLFPVEQPCPHGKLPAGSCWTCNPPPVRSFRELEEDRRRKAEAAAQQARERKERERGEARGKEGSMTVGDTQDTDALGRRLRPTQVEVLEYDARVLAAIRGLGDATLGQLISVLDASKKWTVQNAVTRLLNRDEIERRHVLKGHPSGRAGYLYRVAGAKVRENAGVSGSDSPGGVNLSARDKPADELVTEIRDRIVREQASRGALVIENSAWKLRLEADNKAREQYVQLLLKNIEEHPECEHVFDRLERLLCISPTQG